VSSHFKDTDFEFQCLYYYYCQISKPVCQQNVGNSGGVFQNGVKKIEKQTLGLFAQCAILLPPSFDGDVCVALFSPFLRHSAAKL